MSAQYRFSLIYVLGLLTLVAGAIVIVMACLAMAGWIFGVGVFSLKVPNPDQGSQFGSALGITPDAALCFLLCGVALWVLRESARESLSSRLAAERFLPAEKFLMEAAFTRASLIRIADEDSEETWEEDWDGAESERPGKKSFTRRFARRAAQVCASGVAAMAVIALVGDALGWDANLAFAQWFGIEGVSTRMAPGVAIVLLLNGIALVTLDVETGRGARPAQYLALIVLFLSLASALGLLYRISSPEGLFAALGWFEMTTPTLLVLTALSVGVICARPRNGIMALLTSQSAGGRLARRLAPAAILVPATFAWLKILGEKARYFDSSYGIWLMALLNILSFLILIWRSAVSLHNADTDRAQAETALYNAYSDLQKRVSEQSAELARANQDLWAEMIEREQVEQELGAALRKSEAQLSQFKLVIDAAPVMIWMSGPDKVYNFFNKWWLDYTGRTIEQEMDNGWAEGIYPEDFESCLCTYVEAFNARREFKMEYRLRRRDGHYRWVLNHGAPRFNPDGSFAGYAGCCIDIHERKEVEEALRSSEEFIRSILESSADRIETLDTEGRLISMNRSGMRLMEIDDLSKYAGVVWADLIEGEARAAARDAIRTANAGGVGHFIGACKTARGGLKWWDVIVSPALGRRGQPEYLIAISRDITEARRVEQERDELLARAQAARGQAEDANRLKDEFLANVSHELRAPLNAIQGWVKLLRDGRLKPDEAARALETIERSTRSQNRIISDLLDVSRIITGKLRLNVRPINPAKVIESAVEALRPGADAKEISIEVVVDDDAGQISGDSDRLRQIVWNLLSNAIKFTPNQGHVQIRLERAGSNVEIIVSDTGVGIEPDFLPYVFDRFRQGDSSSTRRQGGLGLGLAIVRHLAEMHGGSVRAESPGLDQGATFVVTLPLLAPNQLTPPPNIQPNLQKDNVRMRSITGAASAFGGAAIGAKAGFKAPAVNMDQAPELDGLRVLAVDDDSDARDLIRAILTQCGAVVETAGSTDQALAVFDRPEEWQPELLISDIEMPEADGYQLICRLREIEKQRGRRIPAIALTAYARAEDRLRSLSAGFQMHVTKPVEPAELLTIVASLTGRLNRPRSLYEVGGLMRQEARNC